MSMTASGVLIFRNTVLAALVFSNTYHSNSTSLRGEFGERTARTATIHPEAGFYLPHKCKVAGTRTENAVAIGLDRPAPQYCVLKALTRHCYSVPETSEPGLGVT